MITIKAIYTSIEDAFKCTYSLTAIAYDSLFASQDLRIEEVTRRQDWEVLLPPAVFLVSSKLPLTSQLLVAKTSDAVQDVFVLTQMQSR